MTRPPKATIVAALFAPALVSITAAQSVARESDGQVLGLVEYRNSCAACHGAEGRGDGPLATQLQSAPPDLTRLEAENGGLFPLSYVYEVIAYSFEVDAHGSSDMPAWGQRYDIEAEGVLGTEGAEGERQIFVTFRILSLIEYLMTLQTE